MLTCVQPTEAAEYLNVVKNEEETTVLHEAVDEQKSLEFTEILLNAGAEMRTNAKLLTPQIEKLFSYENDDKIPGALVDAVVEKVKAGLITEANGADLLFVDRLDSSRKSLFHLAKESNWKTIAKWYNRYHEACSWMIERASTANDLERFVTWVRDGDWEDKDMGRRLLMRNKQGVAALSLLDFQTQQEVALWNKEATAQAAHLMPVQFIDWLFLFLLQLFTS